MAQANQSDFLGSGGTFTDPFAGLVSAPTADDFTAIQANQERQRRAALEASARRTANTNAAAGSNYDPSAPLNWVDQHYYTTDGGKLINRSTGATWEEDQKRRDDANDEGGFLARSAKTIGQHPALLALPAAPFAVAGAGALATGTTIGGQLGFDAGAGTLAAGAPETVQVANEATGGATAGPGFTQDAANAYNAAASSAAAGPGAAASVPTMGGVGAGTAGTAGGAAGTAASSALSPLAKGAIQGLTGAALPLLIQGLTGGRTSEEKALLAKQQQLAEDAQRRQGEVQDARMNTLAQQVLAFNPRNQMLSQMFGPSAAFTPQQAAGMVQGPAPDFDPAVANYQGPDLAKQHQASIMLKRKQQYDASEAARQQAIQNGFQAPGAGPAPINLPAPQAARKY